MKRSAQGISLAASLALGLSLTAHASADMPNTRLTTPSTCSDAEVDLKWEDAGQEVVILSISGGGKRASAYAYGVLSALQNIPVGPSPADTLLHAVDFMSGVSGGSVPAAYYVLNRHAPDPLKGFKEDFLFDSTEWSLGWRVGLHPGNWWKFSTSSYSRTDVLADYLDKVLFQGKTFDDLPPFPPYLVINATDLATGTRFNFTPFEFNCIGSDLKRFRLAHAVAASAAYPVWFPNLTLQNFLFPPPPNIPSRRKRGPFIPLVDGGLVDNYAMRVYLDMLRRDRLIGGLSGVPRSLAQVFVYIRIDASGQLGDAFAGSADSTDMLPRLEQSFNIASAEQIRDSYLLFRKEMDRRVRDSIAHCTPGMQFKYIEALLYEAPADLKPKVANIPTRWSLDDDVVVALIEAGRRAIDDQRQVIQEVVALLKAPGQGPPVCRQTAPATSDALK